MAFCSFSSQINQDGTTLVDNAFINEFMPQAPAEYVKIYLYGLSLCSAPNQDYNAADSASTLLGITEEDLIAAYNYWQELGIVQILSSTPLEVKYLPLKYRSGSAKLRAKGKYADFNNQVQAILSGRMIRPIEYNEYYNLIEGQHFEPEALVMIIKYCALNKGENVSSAYIMAVAKSFAQDNIKTTEAVEQKLLEQEKNSKEIGQVLKALGLNRKADIDERNTYLKWTGKYGFNHNVIMYAAKLVKRGGVGKLDEMLTKFYEQRLFSITEIEEFSTLRGSMFEAAKVITRKLGLYYQNLENVVDTYVSDWFNKGYSSQTLELIGDYCFKHSYRSLDAMNDVVGKFYKLGLVSAEAIGQYTSEIISIDKNIKEILQAAGLVRGVNSGDREFYKTWTTLWGFSQEAIMLVAAKSAGKMGALSYINKVLSNLHEQGKTSLEAVTKSLASVADNATAFEKGVIKHEYTKEELDALFDSIDNIEV